MSWLSPFHRWRLAQARKLAAQVPAQVTLRTVLGVPVWISSTEDSEEPEIALKLLLLPLEEEDAWLHHVPLQPQDACWFVGQVQTYGRRLLVASDHYAPSVSLDGRFGPYGVLSCELAQEVVAVRQAARVGSLVAPRPLAG